MSTKKTWFVTGASCGIGVDIARAALAAGHAVVATLIDTDSPPLRWVAGADAVAAVEQRARDLLTQVDDNRALSTSLAHDVVSG